MVKKIATNTKNWKNASLVQVALPESKKEFVESLNHSRKRSAGSIGGVG